jgi:hypothetical protein
MPLQTVSFVADKPTPAPAADAWPWQAHASYRIRSLITIALAIAGVVASAYVFRWMAEWADWSFAAIMTAFLTGLMPARHYFQRSHPALARAALWLWAAVLGLALIAAAIMTTPRTPLAQESPAAVEHEQELFNARNYPPRYQVEAMRSRAVAFCPDYEWWPTYLLPWRACWDARKFEGWLAQIDAYKANDRKLIEWSHHPQRPPVASWWPGWGYVGHEAHMLPMRLLIVLIAAVAFWGAVEMQNVMLTGPAVSAGSTPTGTVVSGKTETERAFEAWAAEYLIRDSAVDTPTELLRIAYRLACMAKGWPEYNAEAFGRKLASWAREKLKTFEREGAKKMPAYIGLALKDDAITQEARRSFEGGA